LIENKHVIHSHIDFEHFFLFYHIDSK